VRLAPVVTGRAAHGMRSGDIRHVLAQGRRFTGQRVSVTVLTTDGEPGVAFVSSRGVGGAVARNRARRLMREAWRALPAPTAATGHRTVVMARPEIAGAHLDDVRADLQRVLMRAGVIG
jgi:ribonuclease P protein component